MGEFGAYITYIGVFFIFLLTLITGYAWRAIDYIKIQYFSATVTKFAFRAKLVSFFLVFKFIEIFVLTSLTWSVALWTRFI